jgi:hypothetical protein
LPQTIQHAKEHLYRIRKMILDSDKYSKYIVTKWTELLVRDEITKVTAFYIRYPEREAEPYLIFGNGKPTAANCKACGKQTKSKYPF